MKALEYLDAVKAKHGVTSDYALAKLLKCSTQKVSNWRAGRELPGTLMCFRIAELLSDQPAAVIADIELERSERGEREADVNAWRDLIGKIGGGAVAVVLAMGLTTAPSRSDAGMLQAVDDGGSVYYVKSSQKVWHRV
ncbi:MAG: hypothetical protein J0H69_00565 [Burkholderiales bacterium]|nr:hypothetical protein [Burkholderiales bacterium]